VLDQPFLAPKYEFAGVSLKEKSSQDQDLLPLESSSSSLWIDRPWGSDPTEAAALASLMPLFWPSYTEI